MPSRDFVERMLTTGQNEPLEELEEEPLTEDETSEVTDEATAEESEAVEEPEEEAQGEPEEDEDEPSEEEETPPSEAVEQEDEFYLGRYKTREDAEAGWIEKEGMISRQGTELQELRERQAQVEGYLQAMQAQQQGEPGDFEEWADAQFEQGNAWGGAEEVLDTALRTGEAIYVDAYIESWKEHDPFEAARFRTMVDNQIAAAQQQAYQERQPPPLQESINAAWLEVAATDPDLKDPEIAKGVGTILRNNPALRASALSGDPELLRSAIAIARDGYKIQARTGTAGTPRKVRSSDAEQLRKDKLDATVTTGDSSPERGNGSTPEVPPELQEMVQRIQAGEAGFPRLRE